MIEDTAAARKVDGIDADLFGIAGVIPLIKFMSAAKLRSDGIPDQLEELDSVESGHSGTAEVPIDERPQVRICQILAAGRSSIARLRWTSASSFLPASASARAST